MIAAGPELLAALLTLTAGSAWVLIVQVWRFSDRLARVDERIAKSLECCSSVAQEQRELVKVCEAHGHAMARAGLI